MMKRQTLAIQDIYVPVPRQTLDPKQVEAVAESMMEKGQDVPFLGGQTSNALFWLRACIEWKPAGHSERQRSLPTWFRRGNIDLCSVRCWSGIGTILSRAWMEPDRVWGRSRSNRGRGVFGSGSSLRF
jgi:hypothetical protein